MWTDEIVEEIHQIRQSYAESLNNDLDAIFSDLRKKQAEGGRETISLSRQPGLTTRWSGRPKDLGTVAKDIACRST
jgi:hypothetical protein